MEVNSEAKLSRRNLWGYAIGAIPNGLLAFVFGLKYIEFFFDELLLDPGLFIIGQIIYMTVNALNDPLTGQLSDRTNREKWGSRRLIYIKYGGPIYALTFLLVWFPWSLDNQMIIFIHYVLSICLFDTMLSLIALVWLALLPEMTSDLDERNKANLFALILGALVVIPMFIILGDINPASLEFRFLMIIIAILSTILFWLNSYLSEERPEFQKDYKGLPLWRAMKETLKLKSFIIYIAYNFCISFVGSIGLSYLFAYIFILGDAGSVYFLLIYFFVGYSSYLICMKLRPKWGMRKTIFRFGIIKIISTFIFFTIILFYDPPIIVLIAVAIKIFFDGYQIFKDPIMYLSIDQDELKHGSRREGMFFGMNALFVKPALSLGPIIATILLGAFNFVQGADTQPESALLAIKILLFLIPAIVSSLSLLIMYFHPLYGEKLQKLREDLEDLHETKRKQLK
ncbi:MAG: MFS transporter [Candidatus Hodarchaeota archaeon]